MNKQITGWQWRWRVYVWADFEREGEQYKEDGIIEPDEPLRLTELDDLVEAELNQCKADGNEKFLKDWGWCATIQPDKGMPKRATMAERLERHIKKSENKKAP